MASLTHVCMWSEHGWKRITAEEAAKLQPNGTVSAHSGLFMCELCGQYVTLTNGEYRVRYFKHSASEKDKNCPERTFGAYAPITYKANQHELPIRLTSITKNSFELELGLVAIPPETLASAITRQVKISTGAKYTHFIYSFERLIPDSVTYVAVGGEPAAYYTLETDSRLNHFWPSRIKGIDTDGRVFDSQTGKMLPPDADVQVGKTYYFLSQNQLYHYYESVKIEKVCEKAMFYKCWYIYKIQATAFTQEAARFFLDIHCRLTDSPVSLQPIWPPCKMTPYIIHHNKNTLFMHVSGQSGVESQSFPYALIQRFSHGEKDTVLKIDCNTRQQLISAGRANILKYTYLWKEPLSDSSISPSVHVTDLSGNLLDPGVQYSLPEKSIVCMQCPFDGTADIYRDGWVRESISLKANIVTDIEVQYYDKLNIYQGLDKVFSVSFEKKVKSQNTDENILLNQLRYYKDDLIPVDHSLGAITKHLANYPSVKAWVGQKIHEGMISEHALCILRKLILQNKI